MKTRSRSIVASVLVSALTLSSVTSVASAEDKKPATAATPAASKAPAAPKPGSPVTSAAASTTPDAKALTASGEKKLKANDYAGALADLQGAAAVNDAPELHLGIGQAQDNLGHLHEAVAAYEKFLAAVPKKMEKEGAATKLRVDAIKAMPAHVKVTVANGPSGAPPAATISVDGSDKTVATPADLDLPAGHHKISARAEGFDAADREFDVSYGAKEEIALDLKATPPPPPPPTVAVETPAPPPPPPPPPPPERSKIPAYVTGGIALVAAGVGTGFGIAALGSQSDFNKAPTTKKADDGENQALIADMCFGIAITFGVTSAVLFLSDNGSKAASNDPVAPNNGAPKTATASQKTAENKSTRSSFTITPTPIVNAHGGGAGALIRF